MVIFNVIYFVLKYVFFLSVWKGDMLSKKVRREYMLEIKCKVVSIMFLIEVV